MPTTLSAMNAVCGWLFISPRSISCLFLAPLWIVGTEPYWLHRWLFTLCLPPSSVHCQTAVEDWQEESKSQHISPLTTSSSIVGGDCVCPSWFQPPLEISHCSSSLPRTWTPRLQSPSLTPSKPRNEGLLLRLNCCTVSCWFLCSTITYFYCLFL